MAYRAMDHLGGIVAKNCNPYSSSRYKMAASIFIVNA